MGWYVHLHVCFACDRNEGVAQLAKQHIETLDEKNHRGYAGAFLQNLSERTGQNPGTKGGLSLWGMVGNGSGIAEEFVESLKSFWEDLLSEKEDGVPCSFEHILVFYEEEQSEAANAYEIFWDDADSPQRQLVIRHHEKLPFAWMQA
ncbi:MAG: hypothetical protein KME55_33160 [Nostoc indistinguendum CM1-VF10]|jgi:hypothetical protein|nr:hypothetical protein [Nostoc indistinguendum CM1-VF10]